VSAASRPRRGEAPASRALTGKGTPRRRSPSGCSLSCRRCCSCGIASGETRTRTGDTTIQSWATPASSGGPDKTHFRLAVPSARAASSIPDDRTGRTTGVRGAPSASDVAPASATTRRPAPALSICSNATATGQASVAPSRAQPRACGYVSCNPGSCAAASSCGWAWCRGALQTRTAPAFCHGFGSVHQPGEGDLFPAKPQHVVEAKLIHPDRHSERLRLGEDEARAHELGNRVTPDE
jgi:hypothetical protein